MGIYYELVLMFWIHYKIYYYAILELLSGICSYITIAKDLSIPFNKLNRHLEVNALLYCQVLHLV